MRSGLPAHGPATVLATFLTEEKSAQEITDLIAESFLADEVAVSLAEVSQGQWQVAIYLRAAPNENALRALVAAAAGPETAAALAFERLAAKDWVSESLAGLKPVPAGRFVVHGAHDRGLIPQNRIGVEIEAALAFGTGHHGTTRGCLLALDRLGKSLSKRPAQRILDLGTGSGVLAIAAARALRRRVLATDIDADAVRVARNNAKLNRVGTMVEFVQANGVAGQRLRARAPFDLVFANILLGPLQRLASQLTKIVAPGGHVVLSGLLTSQANAALAAYRALKLERRIEIDGWTTLVLKLPTRTRSVVAPSGSRP